MADYPTLMGFTPSEIEPGRPFTVSVTIDERHTNYHGDCHGGVLYSICMEAVAACTSGTGRPGPGMDGTIHYYRGAHLGDTITATVEERKAGRTVGNYAVYLTNQNGKLLADTVITIMFDRR